MAQLPTVEVKCLTCRRAADRIATSVNHFYRTMGVDVWCHGDHAVLELSAQTLMLCDDFKLEAFRPPPPKLKVHTDNDPGDEDVTP